MWHKYKHKHSFRIIAVFTALIVVFSAFGILQGNFVFAGKAQSKDNTIQVWDGSMDYEFEGAGSKNDPYKITNAAELYGFAKKYCGEEQLTSNNKYFELTTDIYLNDVTNTNWMYNSAREWFFLNKWTPGTGTQGFRGNFNGNGHTVYGMYYENPNDWAAVMGLIPMASGNATISNVNVRHAYVKPNNYEGIIGSIVGFVNRNTSIAKSNVKISKCVADSTVDFSGLTNSLAGGIVGVVRESYVTIEYCGSSVKFNNEYSPAGKGGGILANANIWQTKKISIINSYTTVGFTTGLPGGMDNTSISDDTLYSSNGWWKTNADVNMSVVTLGNMQGKKAKDNMPLLDWDIWETHEKDYPIIKGSTAGDRSVDYYNGEAGKVWSGKVAQDYAGGTGTKTDPYIIETAEQLYKMVIEHCVADDSDPNANYKLAADIYLNDVTDPEWFNKGKPNKWPDIQLLSEGQGFKGRLNGSGHTVYGMYYKDTSLMGGLIPVMAGNSSIKDLHIRNAYIDGQASGDMCYMGTIAGYVQAGASSSITRCSARNIVFGDAKGVGGLVGAVSAGGLRIVSCYFIGTLPEICTYEGGFYSDMWGSVTISDSYTAGCLSFCKSNGIADSVRYATVSQENAPFATSRAISITVVAQEDMIGEKAKASMPELDWGSTWCVIADDYPHTLVPENPDAIDGIVGAVWSGNCAEDYEGGSGTESDPYQIATGEQLYKFVTEHVISGDKPAYYIITEDIKLNDTTSEKWYEAEKLNQWYCAAGINNAFAGHLDGQGHIVSGMYIKSSGTNVKGSLIPGLDTKATVKNLGVTHSYVDMSLTNSEVYGAGLVAYIKYWSENIDVIEENYPVISNCFVDSSVSIKARDAGGIVGGIPTPVKIENCYSVCKITNGFRGGAIIGDSWNKGTIIENCYGCTPDFDQLANGKTEVTVGGMTYTNAYIFGMAIGDSTFVGINDMLGNNAKTGMPGLDYENIWQTVDNSTPVLKMFYPKIKMGTNADARTSTISFVTGVEGLTVDPVTSKVGSKFILPTPNREGYKLEGWYVYPEYQCRYTDDFFPYVNLILYANWEQDSIIQNFEAYTNTEYDVGTDHEYYRPGVAQYTADNVHGGNKGVHRIGNTSAEDEFLINYESELVVGGEYKMTFWVMTDTANANGKLSVAYKNWPDIAESNNGKEVMMSFDSLKIGEWTKITYDFVAKSKWLSFVTTGNTSMYFDDIMIIRTSDTVHTVANNSISTNTKVEQLIEDKDEQEVPSENFVSDKESTEDETNKNDKNDKKKPTKIETNEEPFNYLLLIISIAVAIVVISAVVLIVVIKKKKSAKGN